MADAEFLTYKEKPLVRCGNEIYYGNTADDYIVKFTVLSTEKTDGEELPKTVNVQLLKSDTGLSEKERIVKETVKDSLFDALDFGFVWLERALKE